LKARIARAALTLLAASAPMRAQHAEHAAGIPAESATHGEQCSEADCRACRTSAA
jgi:hypothetical protein